MVLDVPAGIVGVFWRGMAPPHVGAFPADLELHRRAGAVRGNSEAKGIGIFADHDHRIDSMRPLFGCGLFHLVVGIGYAQRFENRARDFIRSRVRVAPDIEVFGLNAVFNEKFAIHVQKRCSN